LRIKKGEKESEEEKRMYMTTIFKNFQHEVLIMGKNEHENIVSLFGLNQKPLMMILEFCEKGDLRKYLSDFDLLPKNSFHPRLQLKFALDISKGLNYLHSLDPPIIQFFFFLFLFFFNSYF
jgi:serine/threonine protein kinase